MAVTSPLARGDGIADAGSTDFGDAPYAAASNLTTIQHITNYGTSAVSGVKSFLQASEGKESTRTGKLATAILEIGGGVALMATARTFDALPIPFIGVVGTVLNVAAVALIGYAIFVNVLPFVPGYVAVHAKLPEFVKPWAPTPCGVAVEAMHKDVEELKDIDAIKKFIKDKGFGFELDKDDKRTFTELQKLLDTAYKSKLQAELANRDFDAVPRDNTQAEAKFYVEFVKAAFVQAEAYMHLQHANRNAVLDVATIGFDISDEVLAMQTTQHLKNRSYLRSNDGKTELHAKMISENLTKTIAALANLTKKKEAAKKPAPDSSSKSSQTEPTDQTARENEV